MEYSTAVKESGWVGSTFERVIVWAEARAAACEPVCGGDTHWFTANDIFEEFGTSALEFTSLPRPRVVIDPPSVYDKWAHDDLIVARQTMRTVQIQSLWREVRREILHDAPARFLPRMKDALPARIIDA